MSKLNYKEYNETNEFLKKVLQDSRIDIEVINDEISYISSAIDNKYEIMDLYKEYNLINERKDYFTRQIQSKEQDMNEFLARFPKTDDEKKKNLSIILNTVYSLFDYKVQEGLKSVYDQRPYGIEVVEKRWSFEDPYNDGGTHTLDNEESVKENEYEINGKYVDLAEEKRKEILESESIKIKEKLQKYVLCVNDDMGCDTEQTKKKSAQTNQAQQQQTKPVKKKLVIDPTMENEFYADNGRKRFNNYELEYDRNPNYIVDTHGKINETTLENYVSKIIVPKYHFPIKNIRSKSFLGKYTNPPIQKKCKLIDFNTAESLEKTKEKNNSILEEVATYFDCKVSNKIREIHDDIKLSKERVFVSENTQKQINDFVEEISKNIQKDLRNYAKESNEFFFTNKGGKRRITKKSRKTKRSRKYRKKTKRSRKAKTKK